MNHPVAAGGGTETPPDLSILEESGAGFDPTTQHLSKEEKRRTTALMMAIQAYRELIIRDAAMLREIADMNRRNEGPAIHPATMEAMVDAAVKFDSFIAGRYVPAPRTDANSDENVQKEN